MHVGLIEIHHPLVTLDRGQYLSAQCGLLQLPGGRVWIDAIARRCAFGHGEARDELTPLSLNESQMQRYTRITDVNGRKDARKISIP
jgi:hypothetical protein